MHNTSCLIKLLRNQLKFAFSYVKIQYIENVFSFLFLFMFFDLLNVSEMDAGG